MKPTELQINDLVLAPFYGQMVPSRIVSLTEDRIMYSPVNPGPHKPGPYVSNGSNIEPLPLSEESLAMEFPTPDTIAWFPCNYPSRIPYFHISFDRDGTKVEKDINYAHELQRILHVCGIQQTP